MALRFSNFLFPAAERPEDDGRVIEETMAEAKLSDRLGIDVIWLAEHHFDGICAYVDPVTFAAALAVATERAKIGFAVAQMSLHHPVRFAEQMSLIDNLSRGRLVVGLGRGTAYNIYDYQGYGIDPAEAHARLIESEEIMIKAWTTENLVHRGRFWDLRLPRLRPQPYTRPHPVLIRACSGRDSMLEQAREGRPFMMNVQPNDETRVRMDLYRKEMATAGFDEAHVEDAVDRCWVWRNVFVGETDAEAERIAVPAFKAQNDIRTRMRRRIEAEQGVTLEKRGAKPAAREMVEHGLVCGSPATVAEKLAEVDDIGVGGVIMSFRLGDMTAEATENNLRLFMEKVAPEFHSRAAAA